ncbi:hypothetical protein ACSSS7_006080 [Eimeria intestinalis]
MPVSQQQRQVLYKLPRAPPHRLASTYPTAAGASGASAAEGSVGGGASSSIACLQLSLHVLAACGDWSKLRWAKWGSGIVFLFPALYGASLLFIAGSLDRSGFSGALFVFFCFVLGLVCCLTSGVGLFGVCCCNEPAVRSSLALLVLENILAFLFALFLGVCLFRRPTAPGAAAAAAAAGEPGLHGTALETVARVTPLSPGGGRPHLEALLLSPSWHRTAAVCVCWAVLLCTAASSCLLSCIAEYQSWIDAELLLQGMESLVKEECDQQRPTSSDPLLLSTLRSDSSGSTGKNIVAVPFMSYGSESYEALEESRHLRGLCAGIV